MRRFLLRHWPPREGHAAATPLLHCRHYAIYTLPLSCQCIDVVPHSVYITTVRAMLNTPLLQYTILRWPVISLIRLAAIAAAGLAAQDTLRFHYAPRHACRIADKDTALIRLSHTPCTVEYCCH